MTGGTAAGRARIASCTHRRHRAALPDAPMPRAVPVTLFAVLLSVATVAAAAERPSTAGPGVRVLQPALEMPGLDRSRTLRIYLPPGYAGGAARYPVIYMHDGQNLFDDATAYAGEWGVDEAMDELARRSGFEAIVVGIDNGGEKRMNELSPWPNPRHGAAEGEAYLRFVVEVAKPFVDRIHRTRPGPQDTAIIGSSMGGLASHYAFLARPDVFRRAGVLSPSYWFSERAADLAGRVAPPADARVYVYAGGREGESMVPDAERMHRLFAASMGERARLDIAPEGQHDEATWRAVFPRVVAFLFELEDGAVAAR
jgi:predicted alpha/beta superfamily hydrolase